MPRKRVSEAEQRRRDRAWRASKDDRPKTEIDYEPVYCKQCKEEIFQLVSVEVLAPLGFRSFTKNSLKHALVKVQGAKFEMSMWVCGCKVIPPKSRIKDARPQSPRRKKAPKATDRERKHEQDQGG